MKSWKTTVLGLFGAVWVVAEPLLSQGAINWPTLGKAAFIAAFGYFAKDFNHSDNNNDNGNTAGK